MHNIEYFYAIQKTNRSVHINKVKNPSYKLVKKKKIRVQNNSSI